jgi:hypothetical protein
LITFILKKAQHRVINDKHTKSAESALAARTKKQPKPKSKRKEKGQSYITCKNCKRPGHGKPDCYSKGGGKEGQGLRQKGKAKAKKPETVVVTADDEEKELFMFTCTSDYAAIADNLDVLKSKLGTCIDSGASRNYCPDRSKFTNYKEVQQKITTADGKLLSAVGMGDLHIELPNRSGKMQTVFRNAVHAPGMAFTLISIANLTKQASRSHSTKACAPLKTTSLT